MTTTAAHIDDVTNVTPITPMSNRPPTIKRHLQLYKYGKSGILGKKCWKECNVIIYDDSTFKIFKDAEGHKTSIKPIKLEDVVLDLAFGKATSKYGIPPITGDEHNFVSPENFMSIPETKERNKIHWFAAKDEHSLREIMRVIADVVAGRVRPPQLGKGPRGRYTNQEENEKWITYWHAQQSAADGAPIDHENGDHRPITTTLISHETKLVPVPQSPNVVKQEKVQEAKKKEEKPIKKDKKKDKNQSKVDFVAMPTRCDVLRHQTDYGLREHPTDTVPVVRIVGGRRVKEDVPVTSAKLKSPSPTSIPIHRTYHQEVKNGQDQKQQVSPYTIEISNYVRGEPETTTTNISIVAPVKEHFTQHQQHEEVVTENQKTVINVGTTERTVSMVDNSDNAVTYTTTKQSSYHRSTVTTADD